MGVLYYTNNRALGLGPLLKNISVAGGAASVTTYDEQQQSGPLMVISTGLYLKLAGRYRPAVYDMDERKTICRLRLIGQKISSRALVYPCGK